MGLVSFVFSIFALLTLVAGLGVVFFRNPVYSALSLALCLIAISGLFFTLEAYFLAMVQLALYAGAVVVLFVMIVMLFDLKKEEETFSAGSLLSILKVISVAFFFAATLTSIVMVTNPQAHLVDIQKEAISTSKELALQIFTKYVLPFELVGFLLLVVLVGALALTKQGEGTEDSRPSSKKGAVSNSGMASNQAKRDG